MILKILFIWVWVRLALCDTTFKEPDHGLSPISISGNKFVDSKGYQFFLKGIAYQKMRQEGDSFEDLDAAGYIDPLANTATCMRDLEYLHQLNVNVVRAYQIDPNKNHDACMNAFAAKGIYVLCDLPEPETSINRNDPHWDIGLFDRYKAVVDSMSKYNNLLGFFAGNEISNSVANTDSAPFAKAAIRDTKKYIKEKGYRNIPVGYASNDDAKIRAEVSQYFICGEDSDAKADFFGLNMYEWCGYSSYSTSGYRERTSEFANFQIPIFFSEFGCNIVNPRPFTEVEALYGLTMSKVWSGGIAYEYFQHENNYGVVMENSDGSITPLEDFATLSSRYANNHPKKVKVKNSSTLTNSTCSTNEFWEASGDLPQAPDRGKCECLQSTLSCIMTPYQKVKENELLNEVCSKVDCKDIQADGVKGVYGHYSDCSLNQRVSYALDKYYKANGKKAESCNFNDRAVLITNNDKSDLKSIFLVDGRSCDTVLQKYQDLEIADKQYQKHKSNNHKGESKYGRNGNTTESLQSKGTFAKFSLLSSLMAILFI